MHSESLSIEHQVNRAPSPVWTFYLLLVIALVGAPGCTLGAPWILLGRINRSIELWAGRYARAAIHFMFSLNYWLKAKLYLKIPFEIGRANRPCIFVANHRSNLDVFFIISHIPNVRIVAKRALWFVPFLGSMMWVMRQIPVVRGDMRSYLGALDIARRGLAKGDPILIFPEARRCEKSWRGTQRFHPAAFSLAMETGAPVIPLVFVNTDQIWPKGTFAINPSATCAVVSLDAVDPRQYPSALALSEEVQKRINACLEQYAS